MWAVVITQLSGSGPVSASLSAGNTTGSEPSTSYAQWGHGRCELICISGLLCLEGLVSLLPSIPPGSYKLSAFSSTRFQNPEGRDLIVTAPLALNVPRSLVLCSLPSGGHLHLFDHCLCFYAGIMLFLLLLLTQFEIRDGDTSCSSFIFLKIASLFISILSLFLFPATNCLFLKFFYFCSSGNHTCHTFTGP